MELCQSIDEIFIDQMHYKLIDLSLNHSAYYQNVGSQNVSTLRRHQWILRMSMQN